MSLEKLLGPLKTRIANLVGRAVLQRVDDGKGLQSLQVGVLADETREGVERFQNYGFSSVPLPGAEAVVLFVGGRRDHGLAVAVDDRRHRLAGLEEGEVAVYNEAGSSIILKKDGTLRVEGAGGGHVVLKANGDIEVTAAGAVLLNGGGTPVAKEGSATTGHVHTLAGTAGPFGIVGTAVLQTDTVATGAGSPTVEVP